MQVGKASNAGNQARKSGREPFQFEGPDGFALVYTIRPGFGPPDTPQNAKIALTMDRRFASDWNRQKPGIPLIVFKQEASFLRQAEALELVSTHIERLRLVMQ